jgi:hypothetical protein
LMHIEPYVKYYHLYFKLYGMAACSLNIKALCIGIVNLILLMLLFSDPERSVNTSSS